MAVVNVPGLLMWAASVIAAVWKVSQLVRVPRDKDLRVIAACTVLVFLALSAQLAVSISAAWGGLPGQSGKLIQNVFLTFFFALLIVLLQSSVSAGSMGARGYREVALALLASCGLVATFMATNPTDRGASYEAATGDPGVLAFYLVGNLYMAYATARGAYLSWTAAGHTESRARLSLRLAAAGLVVCCVGAHLPRVLYTSGQLILKRTLLPGTETWTTPILTTGIVCFFLGIGYPGVRTAIVKMRLWIEMRRRYHHLRPLWVAVCRRFPSIALFSPVHPIREVFHLRYMRLRYYRRVVECRDGLVCLSPYIDATELESAQSAAEQAELVRNALTRGPKGAKRASTVSVIAAPAAYGAEADTKELLTLSRALGRITTA